MNRIRQILAIFILMFIGANMLHGIIPHAHSDEEHTAHVHHHEANLMHSHHSSDEEVDLWNLFSLLFAHHSHAIDAPLDPLVLMEEGESIRGFLIGEVNELMWFPMINSPHIDHRHTSILGYSSRSLIAHSSLRAPPSIV